MGQTYKPKSGRVYDNDGLNEPLSQDTSRERQIAEKARQSVDDIDALLAENDRAALRSNEEQVTESDTLGSGYSSESAADLREAENTAPEPVDTLGTGYSGNGGRAKKFWTKKKAAAGGILASGGIFAILGIGTITTGPLAVVAAASKVATPISRNDSSNDDLTMRTIILALAGNASRGRLSLPMSKVADKWEAKMLDKTGVRPVYSKGGTNRFVGFEVVDEAKAKKAGIVTDNDNRVKAADSTIVGHNEKGEQVLKTGKNILYLGDGNFGSRKATLKAAGKAIGSNKYLTFAMNKIMVKRAGVNWGIFNGAKRKVDESLKSFKTRELGPRIASVVANGSLPPTTLSTTDATNEDGTPKQTEAAKDATQEVSDLTEDVKSEVADPTKEKTAKTSLKTKLIGGGAVAAAALCMARGLSDGYPDYVYKSQILPMMRMAGVVLSGGGGTMAGGDDISADEVGALVQMLEDPDAPEGLNNFVDAEAVRNVDGKTGGVPTPASAIISADKPWLLNVVDKIFSGDPFNPANWVCDTAEFVSGLPVLQQIGEAANWGIDQALGVFETSIDQLTDSLYVFLGGPEALSEAVGAALGGVAMGGGELIARDAAAATGGDDLTRTEAMQQNEENLKNIASENKEKSVFERYLSFTNPNSLAFALATESPTSQKSFMQTIAQSPGTIIASTFSGFSSKARAAETVGVQPLPTKGWSNALLSDPEYFDLYSNEEVVETYGIETLNERWGKCYGQTVSPTTSLIETTTTVNPVDPEIKEACSLDNVGEMITNPATSQARPERERFRMYLALVVSSATLRCDDGENAACDSLGIPTDEPTSGTQPNTTTTTPTGTAGYGASAEQLAKNGVPEACKTGTATGNMLLVCNGVKYIDKVPYRMVHPYTGKVFSERWAAGVTETSIDERGTKTKLTLDCSLFVGVMLWETYGIDYTTTSQSYGSNKEYFKNVDASEVQPGDLIVSPGHVAISAGNGMVINSSTTTSNSPVGDLLIAKQKTPTQVLRYIGPNNKTSPEVQV